MLRAHLRSPRSRPHYDLPARLPALANDRTGLPPSDTRWLHSALKITGLAEALAERGDDGRRLARRPTAERPDHRRCRLLCARRERPSGRSAAEQRDELAALHHSITSSARTSSAVGTVRPSALAVLRLTYSSILVACWTGRSAGLSPLRIRPV